ncbi:DUF6086 family protein [Kitasatospora sp. NPDC001664]
MSQYYMVGDETLWNPSNGASGLFRQQVDVFQEELGLFAGISRMRADEAQVSPPVLGVFAQALLDRHLRTGHAVIRALSEGFVLTTLVLADRAGVGPGWEPTGSGPAWELRDVQVPARPVTDGQVGELRLKAAELSLAMAR